MSRLPNQLRSRTGSRLGRYHTLESIGVKVNEVELVESERCSCVANGMMM